MFGIGKKRAQDGEKTLREMTLGKACRIMEVELPRGGNAADADTRIGMVYGHPALCKKDSVVICSILGKQEEHCREALGKGASLVIVRQAAKMKFFADNARVVGRDDLFECLSRYERFVRSLFPAKAITITGSVGKTTTTEMIKTVFGDAFRLHASPSVLNSMGGALRIVQTLHNDDEFYLQELGAADTGYIVPSAKGLTPDAVVITNIGEAHLDGYGSRENILKDKASLVENMAEGGVAFFDKDDEMLRSYQTQRRIVFYALNDKTADYYAENIAAADGGQSFEIVERRTGKRFGAHIGLLGDYNVRNALAVFSMGTHFGIPAEKIIRSLDAYRPSGIRQNIRNIGGHTLFLDTFNSAPNTLIGSVQVMSSLPIRPGGRRILVAGDIAHLGKDAESIHYRVGTELARESFDLLITFGSLAANIYRGAVDAGFPHALCFGEEEREKLNDWLRDPDVYSG